LGAAEQLAYRELVYLAVGDKNRIAEAFGDWTLGDDG
jgi:hypothetical protein